VTDTASLLLLLLLQLLLLLLLLLLLHTQLQQGSLSWGALNELLPPVDPTDTILGALWRLNTLSEVSLPKAVMVIRHWAQLSLHRRSIMLVRHNY
jgi:hypothetical protein